MRVSPLRRNRAAARRRLSSSASPALSLALKWSMFSTAERSCRHKTRKPLFGQRHGGRAPVLAPHLPCDQPVIFQLAQRAGGGGAVDAHESRDLGGVFQSLFLDRQKDAPAHRVRP
jgi:hypothetical protein